ncbi:hypothetical protein RI129_004087 [Pyrocoelia pectoralis]|uniref:LRRCT domain-containing protein n=1 Tax=Pyrocoelia pectoralis TaxID=417401 RepID=A0AAN7ZPG4_9COLE
MLGSIIVICICSVTWTWSVTDSCQINACDAIESMEKILHTQLALLNVSESDLRYEIIKLERRVRSLEQPVWPISNSDDRWHNCIQGPCKCKPETKSISCWNKHIAALPPGQVVPQDLQTLDLGVNFLSTLNKDSFKNLPRLTELDLFNNKINHLPEKIFENLWEIQYLTLHKNFLQEISESIFIDLRHLKTLDLSYNKLQSLPSRLFAGNPNLVVLHVSGNMVKVLPMNLFNNLHHLEDLDLSSNLIGVIPESIFHGLSKVKRLKLAENKIENLPLETFRDLESLEHLNLRRNNLVVISPALFLNLGNLVVLELSSNKIVKISEGIFELKRLKELHLQQNFLYELPENLFLKTQGLEKLILFSNTLVELKENSFRGLSNLTSLVLNNNLLKRLHPKVFSHVPNLEKLRLDSNSFLFLPMKSLDYLNKLNAIKLTKNPWHCDCNTLYLSAWINENLQKLWDSQPTCKGPGELGGAEIRDMNFNSLCHGQWASMINLSARIRVRPSTLTPHP